MSSPVQQPPHHAQPTPPITPTASASSDGTVPAYLNLVPGGVGYPLSSIQSSASASALGAGAGAGGHGAAANTAAVAAVQNHYHSLSQAGDPAKATSKAAQLVQRAVQCDAALREMALASSGGNAASNGNRAMMADDGSAGDRKEKAEPPILLPSLSVLTEAAFGPLTGVNPQSVKKWAEALVMAYLDDADDHGDDVRAVLDQCRSGGSTGSTGNSNGGGGPGDDGVDLPTLLRNLHSHYVTKLTSGGDDGTGRVSSLTVPTRPCGYVFRRGDIAWNCRTCQSDSTCVLCDRCFRESDHTGHDVFFHRTSPGGCCDCGDIEAWRLEGCCDRHRPRVDVEEALRKKMRLSEPSEMEASPAAAAVGAVAMEEDTAGSTEGATHDDDPDFEAVRSADRSREETADAVGSLLPPRLAAALGVVIGNAVQSVVRSVDSSAVGSDPVQWEKRWADQARRIRDRCPTDEDYILKEAALATPKSVGKITEVQWPAAPDGNSGPLPPRFRLHLRLHNDDVHTFDEVIDALYSPPSSGTGHRRGVPSDETDTSQGLVAHRNDADDMTHHVDSDGQVTVRTYTTIAGALAGYRRLKSRGLHCSVVSTSQVESELRSRALLQWLAELCSAHPAAGGMVVHALVDVDDGGTSSDIGGVKMWREGRSIPCWVLNDDASSAQWSEAFPPHLASSFLSREEAERLHAVGFGSVASTGSAVISSDEFASKTGANSSFYAGLPQPRLPSERYRKSPHALWGTMVLPTDCADCSETNVGSCVPHPLLSKNGEAIGSSPLLERVMVIDTDSRKPQEADRLTTHMFPHKISGLSIISGVGLVDSSASDSAEAQVEAPTASEWSHLLSTASYSSPPSAILLILMLDPYPPKLLRQPLHSLFLSLLVDARFKSRFAVALGVAYRSLTTLFCAGVGTESDTPLGFTVQTFTAGSLVRALGSSAAISNLLCRDGDEVNSTGVGKHILSIPISHNIVRCIHSNLLGSTKEVKEATKASGPGDTVGADDSGEIVNPALVYQAGEHCMATLLSAAPDDEFLDSRSTRHKRLPHLLRDLEYIFETPGTSVRLLLAVAAGSAMPSTPLQPMPSVANVDPSSCLTFPTVWARLLRIGQGMDPQKRRISGGHVEFEQNRWLEAFGLSLNLAGAYDALAESPAVSGLGGALSDLQILRASVGNIFASLLKEMKSWLYREGLLETGVPVPPTAGALGDLGQLEALQRSTLHLSTSQIGASESVAGAPVVSAIALSCATSVKMTEAQLSLMEQALQQEAQLAVSSGSSTTVRGAVMGDWLRCPHSPLGGDSLSFHLPLHRALARSLRSFCSVTVPTAERDSDSTTWWKLPVLDDETPHDAASALQHPLAALIRPTIRSSNCRVVWAAGPDCTSQEAQQRRFRSRMVASSIAAAKIIHSMCDHPLRCLVASQQIERHLWARNGSAAAGQALNYGSSPLCRSFRDLDLAMVQFSAAGFSVGLGARRVFALLLSRFSLEGYLCDPERRGSGLSPTGSVASGGGSPNSYGPSSGWVNPPRMQDPDHAVALAECFFSTLCILVTELPSPPPTSATDSSALRCSMKRELLHALVAEPRSHSEAMAAVAGAVTRRDETDSGAGSGDADSATSFRALFADVLKEIGKQKSQGSRSSGTPMFELRAESSDEYDPTFFHLRRHEHQHAMDTVARLRRQKVSPPGSPRAGGNSRCLPLVVQPPPSHPRFVPGRLLLHLPALDASIRRALLFALTGGRWLPPDEPNQFLSDDEDNDGNDDEMTDSSKAEGIVSVSGLANATTPSSAATPKSSPRRTREARRRAFQRNTSSSFVKPRRGHSSLSDIGDVFSPETVAGSSVSFLEVLQILTLQVHTLQECASLHRTHALDEESSSLSAGISVNSYLSRLVFTPPSLVDVWALRCAPDGPLPSKGSGLNRGSVLGLLIALYEHRADHGGGSDKGGDSGHADEGHGGARALSADGLKWLLRFVNSLVDGAHTVLAACEAASSGRRHRPAQVGSQSSPSEASEGTSSSVVSSVDPALSDLVSGMIANLADLWPVEVDNTSSGAADADRMSAKSREARKAAQRRAMERMMKAQSSFAASLSVENGGAKLDAEVEDDEEADLCIICRCDDADGENNGPLGFLGHVQRSRVLQLRSAAEATCLSSSDTDNLYQAYRVVGDRGCQLRATESISSRPIACLPIGSIVTILESKVSSKYDIVSRRVRVRYTNSKTNDTIEGWGSMQSSQGYVILSPLTTLCYNSSRWGSTRPLIRQCGHAAHLHCVEAHCLSLHQRAAGDQPYDGRFAANIDDGEFLCPLCKQLSNILIPDVGRKPSALPLSRKNASLASSPEASPAKVASPLPSSSSTSSVSSIRDILCSPYQIDYEDTEEKEDKMMTAIKQFGTRLYLGVQIPWDRMSSSRKREQRAWHPALRRWDFEEEDDNDISRSLGAMGGVDDPAIGGLLRLLRQQHIAWASVGHSVAASEASTRGIMGIEDPWSDYAESTKDSIPAILDLRRTISATSALLQALSYELGQQLGSDSPKSSCLNVTLIGSLLADILEGRFWSVGLPSSPEDANQRSVFKQWQVLTSQITATPCHVARDGMLPQRHEARATASALWATKGMSARSVVGNEQESSLSNNSSALSSSPVTTASADVADDQVAIASNGQSTSTGIEISSPSTQDPQARIPTPLAIRLVCSEEGIDQPLENGWGTMDPFMAFHPSTQAQENGIEVHLSGGTQDVKPPILFRPAVASAYLYVPLLAWDMNTLAGAVFSSMLVNKEDSMPAGNDSLLLCSRTLLLGRLVQVLVTPGGFDKAAELDPNDWEAQEARDEFQEQWERGELLKEAKALANLLAHCRDAVGPMSSNRLDSVVQIDSAEDAAQFLHNVGLAILPFARSLILLLRGCTSLLRQQEKKGMRVENPFKLEKHSTTSTKCALEALLESPETMTCGDGFRILRDMGGPLPSQILKDASPSGVSGTPPSSWFALINRWLSSINGFESYHGSQGRGLVFDELSNTWTSPSASRSDVSSEAQEADGGKKKFIVKEQGLQTASSSEATSTMGVEIEVAPSAEEGDSEGGQQGIAYNASIDMDDASTAGFDDGMGNAEEEDIEIDDDANMEMFDVDVEDDSDDEAEMEDIEMIGDSGGSQASLYGLEDSGVDVSDDEDSSESNLAPSAASKIDKEFANVSRSAMIPFQSSILGLGGIGPGPRGNSFEYSRASLMMSDLSHLGMVHRIGSAASGLIRLPQSFVELYGLVNKVKGRNDIAIGAVDDADDGGSTETAICLITGSVMAAGSSRRPYSRGGARPPGACTLHAQQVGSGVGIFFLVQKCTVLLIHNNKSAYSASLYVDEHGEEDPGLRRGRPLFLKDERYESLEKLWREHSIPREVAQTRSTSDRVIRDNWY